MEEHEQEWIELATAPDQMIAESWREILIEERIPAQLAPGDVSSIFGTAGLPVRLLVPTEFIDRATTLLTDTLALSDDELAGDDDVLSDDEEYADSDDPTPDAGLTQSEDAGGGDTAS